MKNLIIVLLLLFFAVGFVPNVYAGIVSQHTEYHDPYYSYSPQPYYQYASQPQSQIQGIPISISNFQYSPHDIIIAEGTTVSWVNYDSAPHTVTSNKNSEDKFDSGKLESGQVYTRTFSKAGTYYYYCSFHPNMWGVIRVISANDGYYFSNNPSYPQPYQYQQTSYYMYPIYTPSSQMYYEPIYYDPGYGYLGGQPEIYYSGYSNQPYQDYYYYNTSQTTYGY